MKMGTGAFWGIILIVIGASIMFKVLFGISVLRVIIAIAFILIGIKILVGRKSLNVSPSDNDVIFNERRYTEFPLSDTEYNTIFGKTIFDFGDAPIPTDSSTHLKFNTIFGNTILKIPPALPVKIRAEAVFGSAKLPKDNTAVFGGAKYTSDHDSLLTSFVTIEANAVFGNIEIIQNEY